jgi:hypothetical protein
MKTKPIGLLPPDVRRARLEAKRRSVLRWLRDETWSTPEILGRVMGVNARQGVYQTLTKLEHGGYLTSADVPIFKKATQRVVGITAHGLAHAFDLGETFEVRPTFEPSKVKVSTLQHEVDIQMLRFQAECAGWTNWIPGTRLGISRGGDKRPDAVARDPEQNIVALEIERTIKTSKRYEVLLSQYFQAVAKGRYARVIWLSPTLDLSLRLKRIIFSISAVPVGGKRIPLEPRHYQLLDFLDYSQWPPGRQEKTDGLAV